MEGTNSVMTHIHLHSLKPCNAIFLRNIDYGKCPANSFLIDCVILGGLFVRSVINGSTFIPSTCHQHPAM